jgi:hypothetical protein
MKASDRFQSTASPLRKLGLRLATVAVFMAASAIAMAQQPFVIVEGSTHNFNVTPADAGNALEWGMFYNTYDLTELPAGSYTIPNKTINSIALTVTDMSRAMSELVFLIVSETAPTGCTTRRGIPIMIEPNNMFLEFASAETQDCFNMGDYYAPLKVGLNFKNKLGNVPIPESRFPLTVTYTIRDVTNSGPVLPGNNGEALVIEYNAANDYFLLVKDAIGSVTKTTEYELTITSVTDKHQAAIKNNNGDIRLQIRIINHLPQSGNMNMAMAYVVKPMGY